MPEETPKEKMDRIKEELIAKRKEEEKNKGLASVIIGENFVTASKNGDYKLNWKNGKDYELDGLYGYSNVTIGNRNDSEVMNFVIRSKEDVKLLNEVVRPFGFVLKEEV